jgi:hypothetical protein
LAREAAAQSSVLSDTVQVTIACEKGVLLNPVALLFQSTCVSRKKIVSESAVKDIPRYNAVQDSNMQYSAKFRTAGTLLDRTKVLTFLSDEVMFALSRIVEK